MPRRVQPHGTNAAYQRHMKAGEPACEQCRAARAAYTRAYRSGVVSPRKPAECGTLSGYYGHRYRTERACQSCLDAYAAYTRERRSQLRQRARVLEAAWAEVLAESGVL